MRVHFEKVMTARTQSFGCREFRSEAFTAPFHFHPEYELTAIVAGRGRRFVGDSVEDFGPGDLVLLGANLPHRWASTSVGARDGASHSIVLQFRRDCLGESFWDLPEMRSVSPLLDRSRRGLHFNPRAAAEAIGILSRLKETSGGSRLSALIEILECLSRARGRMLASSGYNSDVSVLGADRIDRVISHVEANFQDEGLGLAEASRVAALTPGAFSRFFSRATGRTFVSFVNEVRLSHVCRMLTESDDSVAGICFGCGFGTTSNFHQKFRDAKKMSPLAYRRLFRDPTRKIPHRFSIPHPVPRPPLGAQPVRGVSGPAKAPGRQSRIPSLT